MKKLLSLLVLSSIINFSAAAQCPCGFRLEIIQSTDDLCCFDVQVCSTEDTGCTMVTFTELHIRTDGGTSAPAEVGQVMLADGNFAFQTEINSVSFIYTGGSDFFFADCGSPLVLGQFCIEDAPDMVVEFSATLSASGGADACMLSVTGTTFNVPCFIAEQFYSISGTITRPNGDPVPSVTVDLTGNVADSDLTGAPGTYFFGDIPAGSDETVTPFLDADPLECVSVRDVLFIGKHIQNIVPLQSPYAIIAADVDNNNTVNSSDIIELLGLILGENANFANNTSWTFVNADYIFPVPANPWAENYPEDGSVNDLQEDTIIDFIAVKTGDATECIEDEPGAAFLTLSAGEVNGQAGDQVQVDVSVTGFTDVSGLQFSMEWDTDIVQFDQVDNLNLAGLAPLHFNTGTGGLSLAWITQNLVGLTVDDGSVIFTLSFTLVGDPGDVSPVAFVETPTPFEVIDDACNPFGLNSDDGTATILPEPVGEGFFETLCGDTARNVPTEIKAFDDGVYVAGTRRNAGIEFATFSKYDAVDGTLVWDLVLNEGSIFHDFEYVPETDEFLLVGATEPFQIDGVSQDNESILVKVDDSGNLVFGRRYQQLGREHFNRIIRHPDPRDENAPFYIVGTINPPEEQPFYPPPPSATDRIVVLNINADGGVVWANTYDYAGTDVPDDEFHRGLFATNTFDGGFPNNGDIVITGNDSPTNDGIVVEIHGGTGEVVNALKLESGLDIYDGFEFFSGQFLLVGEDFANGQAFFSVLGPDMVFDTSFRFEHIRQFRDIGVDLQGQLYMTGTNNFAQPATNYNIIQKVNVSGGYGPGPAWYLDNGGTAFTNPRISVTFFEDKIYYADGRLDSPNGFGNYDLLVGAFDLDLSSACRVEADAPIEDFIITPSAITVTTAAHTLPAPADVGTQPLEYQCTPFCEEATCEIDFDWMALGCGEVQFTALPVGNSPVATYNWDVGCDNNTEADTADPLLEFDPCGETVSVCLTVLYENGSTCSYEEEIVVPGDNTPPLVVAVEDIEVIGTIDADGNCTAQVSVALPIVTEDCTRMGLTNDYTGTADASGIYPQGVTVVTFTASDECGNTTVFEVTVKVGCRNCGEAVVTCFPGFLPGTLNTVIHPDDPVLGIVDVRNYDSYGSENYLEELSGPENIYHPANPAQAWSYSNLGLVFGLALDTLENIYTSSTTLYGCSFSNMQSQFGPSGNSRIYKIKPSDEWEILVEQGPFVPGGTTIPSDGAGFGNICYDPDHHQLFATNFHDGYIYRIDLNNNIVVDFFDPFSNNNPVSNDDPNFVALGERPWAVAYNPIDGRLYYSKWNEDRQRIKVDEKNEIWQVEIDAATGGFADDDERIIELPDHIDTYSPNSATFQNYSNPVSDIAFSAQGVMLIAERSMRYDCGDVTRPINTNWFEWYAHQARVLEYEYDGAEWVLTPGHGMTPFTSYADDLKYQLSSNHPSEGATTSGGVDYGYESFDPTMTGPIECDVMMWASGDFIACQVGSISCNDQVYGIQGNTTAEGGTSCDGYIIDFDGNLGCFNKVEQGDVEIFKCLDCPKIDTCRVSFGWTVLDCATAQFTAQPFGDSPVVEYRWDLGCDGTVESDAADPQLQFDLCGGDQNVCLTVIYENGDTCAYENLVSLPADILPPQITCPAASITVSTDPGTCNYTFAIDLLVTDNCDPDPQLSYELSGATTGTGTGLPTQLELGSTTVTVTAVDLCGNESDPCIFEVQVADNEAPGITCPTTFTESVQGCCDGTTVDFPFASATDNCGSVTIDYDPPNGSFFPCGPSTVTATATDEAGNTSTCTFEVVVEGCEDCARIISSVATCGEVSGMYEFTILAENLTKLPFSEALVSLDSDATINELNWDPDNGVITGMLSVLPPLPPVLELAINFSFNCEFGAITCTLPIEMATPCCEEIALEDQALCIPAEVQLSLIGDLDYLNNVDFIQWYVAGDCENFNLLYSSSPDLSADGWMNFQFPSSFYPNAESVCVYAQVTFGGEASCQQLTTNIAMISLCDPSEGTLENGNGDYCSGDLPGTFAPLEFTGFREECGYSFQWSDESGPIEGATGSTYQPVGLTFDGDPAACLVEHVFTLSITNFCGTQEIPASIFIYNEDAPVGELTIDPDHPSPLCNGGATSITYEPACADPYQWLWQNSADGADYTPLEAFGTVNPTINTNILFEDIWYQVTRTNGACPADEVAILVEVRDALQITSFTVEPDDGCTPTEMTMQAEFSPPPVDGCPYAVNWYKDGILLTTTTHDGSPATYIYSGQFLDGNYYASVYNPCCEELAESEIAVIDPPMEVFIVAPCFRCNGEEVILEGVVLHPPGPCVYQWYQNGMPLSEGDGPVITVDEGDALYTFEAICGDCEKQASYYLLQCNPDPPASCVCDSIGADAAAGFTYEAIGERVYEFRPMASLEASCNELTWQWGDGTPAGQSVGAEPITHTFSSNGPTNVCMDIARTEMDGSTCVDNFCMLITGLYEAADRPSVRLYPNPVTERVTLEIWDFHSKTGRVQVLDVQGKIVLTTLLAPQQQRHYLMLGGLSAGSYQVRILDAGKLVWNGGVVKQ